MGRIAILSMGGALVVFGAILSPLPGPWGLPFSLGGMILLLRNSRWLRKIYIRGGQRWPWLRSLADRMLRRRAEDRKKDSTTEPAKSTLAAMKTHVAHIPFVGRWWRRS